MLNVCVFPGVVESEPLPSTTVVKKEPAKWYMASLGCWDVSLSTGSPRQGTVQNLDVVQIIFMKGDGMESMPGTTVVELEPEMGCIIAYDVGIIYVPA